MKSDPYLDRREALHRLPAVERITAIEIELATVRRLATEKATWHRKKLLRMQDAARLEARQVTPRQLQQENSPFSPAAFKNSRLIWSRRARA